MQNTCIKNFPSIEIHGSTQMTVANHYEINYLKELGFKRIVLPRELSFEEIKEETSHQWQELMDRFEILDTGGEDRTFFDHCLYRSLLFPQTCYEVTPEGKAVHRDFAPQPHSRRKILH